MKKFTKKIQYYIKRVKSKFFNKNVFVYNLNDKKDLIIFDDVYPRVYGDWRMNEHNHYLRSIPNSIIYTGNLNNNKIKVVANYAEHKLKFLKREKSIEELQVKSLTYKTNINCKLAYCLFFNNIIKLYPYYKEFNIPFAFTLYPGGGFQLFNEHFNKRLQRVFDSPLFKHVFVNMPFVYNYIKEVFGVPDDKITFIYCGPLEVDYMKLKNNELNPIRNEIIKMVFIAQKYSSFGIDKGLDVFCKVAKYFEKDDRFEFSVVGNFTEDDFVVEVENIKIKGNILPKDLYATLSKYDIVISPNRSFILYPGAFDGFPTGSVIHAALSGNMMMVTDSLENSKLLELIDMEDLVLISDRPSDIVQKLIYFIDHPKKIKRIASNGRKKLIAHCDFDNQLSKRLKIIKSLI